MLLVVITTKRRRRRNISCSRIPVLIEGAVVLVAGGVGILVLVLQY